MDTPGLLVATAAVAVLLAVAVLALTWARAERRRLLEELHASRSAVSQLRGRVEELSGRLEPVPAGAGVEPSAGFVITSLARGGGVDGRAERAGSSPSPGLAVVALPARDFATVALTESVLRVVSLTHGVRRALSAENRNRIRFEVAREVRRSRRQRRRDLKEARRHLRAQTPAGRDAA
jgi:hypothetical protein